MRIIRKSHKATLSLAIAMVTLSGCNGLVSKSSPKTEQETYMNALGNVGSVVCQDPKSERKLCIDTAKSLVEGGHAREAILLYEKAESLCPDQPKLHKELAALYATKEDFSKAIQRYQSALEKESDPDLLNNYLWTLMEANRVDQALTAARRGQTQFPHHEGLKSTLAVIEYKKGNRDAAFKIFESIMGTAPAYHNLAVLDIDHGNAQGARKNLMLAISQSRDPNPLSIQLLKQLDQYTAEQTGTQRVAAQPLQ